MLTALRSEELTAPNQLHHQLESATEHARTALVYVGTADGSVFSISPSSDDAHISPVRIGRSAVTHIRALAHCDLLLALCDGAVSVLSLPSLRRLDLLARGRSAACLEPLSDGFSILIGARRRLLLYSAKSTSPSLEFLRDISLPESPRALYPPAPSSSFALLVFRREYHLVDLERGHSFFAVPTGRLGNHGACSLPEHELVANSGNPPLFTVLQDAECTFLSISIADETNGSLSISTHETFGSDDDDHHEPIRFSEPPTILSCSFPHFLAACSRKLESRCLLGSGALSAVSHPLEMSQRVKAIVPQAVSQPCSCRDTESSDVSLVTLENQLLRVWQPPLLHQIQELAAQNFFESALVLSSALSHESLRERTRHGLRARYGYVLCAAGRYDDAMQLLIDSTCSVDEALSLIPGLLPERQRKSRSSFAQLATDVLGEWTAPELEDPQDQRDADLARASAVPFLETRRQAELRQSSRQDAVLLDTALVKALVANRTSFLTFQGLFWEPSFMADIGEVEATLSSAGREEEVIELLRSKERHRDALSRVQRLWYDECEQHRAASISEEDADESKLRFGPSRMAEYIMNLDGGSNSRAIALEFTPIILQESAGIGMQVLDSLRPQLSVDEVLEHLHQHCPGMRRMYLERLIQKDSSSLKREHFDYLVRLYLDDSEESDEESDERSRLRAILASSTVPYTPYRALSRLQQRAAKTWARERAVVYGRLGQHEEAVESYAKELRRPDLAEAHCDNVFLNTSESSGAHAYLVLLKVLLEDDGSSVAETDATKLLARKGDRFDLMQALSELPEALRLGGLMPFFQSALRTRGDKRRNLTVMSRLYKAENERLRAALADSRKAHIVITAERTCSVCRRRIDTSAFATSPQGELKHYRCYLASAATSSAK